MSGTWLWLESSDGRDCWHVPGAASLLAHGVSRKKEQPSEIWTLLP